MTALSLMVIVTVTMIPAYTMAWESTRSFSFNDYENMVFDTHKWLAWEAASLFPEEQVAWITNNLKQFWLGVEAADANPQAANNVGLDSDDYGKIHVNESILYLDITGTTVTNDTLATYAEGEYNNLITELAKENIDYSVAAFYAGAMSSYISQAATYATYWNETLWGELNRTRWAEFESIIDSGIETTVHQIDFLFSFQNTTLFSNEHFTLTPSVVAENDAYNASVDLSKAVYQYGKSMQNNYVEASSPLDWSTAYRDNITVCLTSSVEAIYSAILKAMNEVDWHYIDIPDPIINYDNNTHHLNIPDFQVTFTNESGTYNLDNLTATTAEAWYIFYDDEDPDLSLWQSMYFNLTYNDTSDRWYHPDGLAPNTAADTNHSIVYKFDMNRSAIAWSKPSDLFFVDYYDTVVYGLNYRYYNQTRELSIYNLVVECTELPEIGIVTPEEVTRATWHLYEKSEGSGITHTSGVPKRDTEGTMMEGPLIFNETNGTSWYSYGNDIGWVFSTVNTELYVIVQFELIIPTGHSFDTGGPSGYQFVPFTQKIGGSVFRNKDHNITISEPRLVGPYEMETLNGTRLFISAYDIKAWTDHKDIALDYYQIYEKSVYGEDTREARWKIFLWDNITSHLSGDLLWSVANQTWYIEDIDVTNFPDNWFKLGVRIVNMNVNASNIDYRYSEWFEMVRPMPIIYYILPEFFLAGFIVLFGWLAWYRPRKKRLKIEAEREEKLEKVYD
jgi:hypothetical protein